MRLQGQRQRQRSLAAELNDQPVWLLLVADVEHVLESEWLEVQPVAGVVVGRHGLRIAVDHDRLVAQLLQGERRMAAAVVELDALPDAVGPGAQDHDLAPVRRLRLGFFFVDRVQVRREALEFGRARVHALEHRPNPPFLAPVAHGSLGLVPQARQPVVGQTGAFRQGQLGGRHLVKTGLGQILLQVDYGLELRHEPWVDAGHLADILDTVAFSQREADVVQPVRVGSDQTLRDQVGAVNIAARLPAGLEGPDGLPQRVLERRANSHDFADRLHLHAEHRLGARKLLELPLRHLDHDIVDAGLEARRRLLRDVVGDLVQAEPDGQLGRDLGDREAGRLRRQS